jgi:ParB/RepB/Spo0J family partition protein
MRRPQPEEQVVMLPIDQINRHPKARPLNDETLQRLCDSIVLVGLLAPIHVTPATGENGYVINDKYVVVAGHHRFAACDLLGHGHIPCFITYGDDLDTEMVMIAENLHRAELTSLERAEQVARWIELSEMSQASKAAESDDGISGQSAQKVGRPIGGLSAATRDLGIERTAARRAVKVAGLSDEAKAVARETGLDDNRTALLTAARQATPQAQVQVLRERAQQAEPRTSDRSGPASGEPAELPSYEQLRSAILLLSGLKYTDYLQICPPAKRAAMCQQLTHLVDVFELVRERATT